MYKNSAISLSKGREVNRYLIHQSPKLLSNPKMTWNAHSYVGLFQTIFYVPALAAATYQLLHKHGRPRMAWMGLTLFSAGMAFIEHCLLLHLTILKVRIAGGIVLILFVNNEASVSYIIASLVLQGTGVLPLLLCTIGLLRLMLVFSVFVLHIN